MNYYEHHIGDYDKATAHLSACEDGIYCRLLRRYYDTEQPLKNDIGAIQRFVRARTREEKNSVVTVLSEFFFLGDDECWHHRRCDSEIEKFLSGEPEREIKKANESNRLKRHREERSALFKQLTDAGQHAPWNIGMNELRDLVKRLGETPSQPLPATAPATPATATQTPDTRHQTPEIKESTALSGKPDPAQAQARKKLSEECAEVLAFLNEKTGRNYQPVKANIQLIAARLREGATVVQLRQVIAKKCREWRDDPTQEIYLRPKTLFNATNFANYQGELVA